MEKAKVYFTKEITPESLVKMFDALAVDFSNSKVGVKISTGEPGGHNYLKPELIGSLVDKLDGTIIECCTAYGGGRQDPALHWKAIEDHGFKPRFKCDIMDEHGEIEIPVHNGFHLDKDIIGKDFDNYDKVLILSHFKGHMMGGFGGALKNIAIGIASSRGKGYIHTAGKSACNEGLFEGAVELPAQDDFLESMADACEAVISYKGKENMVYINVANRLSVDCDCDSHPAEPEMADIGIFASLDPVAIDHACYDAVKNSTDPGKAALIERMDTRHAIHTAESAEKLGLGSMDYEIIEI